MTDTLTRKKYARIKKGEWYEVESKFTKHNGERYWCFIIPNAGSGHFDIDKYFITPEKSRELQIDSILND